MRCVKCTSTRQLRPQTGRVAARRQPHDTECEKSERIGEDLHRSPPKGRPFFSSTRRHTRLQGDWSSDVCSSDLAKSGVEHRGLSGVDGKRRRRASEARNPEPMSIEPESLQNDFDSAFAGIGQVREAFTPRLTPREVGTIAIVATGIAQVSGLPGVGFDEVLTFPGDVPGIAFNVDAGEIGVVLLGEYWHLHAGDEVQRTGRVMDVEVGTIASVATGIAQVSGLPGVGDAGSD